MLITLVTRDCINSHELLRLCPIDRVGTSWGSALLQVAYRISTILLQSQTWFQSAHTV